MSELKRGRKPTPFEVNIERFRKLVDSKSSREEIAKAIGCDTSTITKHYNEKQGIDIEFLKKYAEYFNVSADYLLGVSEGYKRGDDFVNEITEYTGLSTEVIEKLHLFTHEFLLWDEGYDVHEELVNKYNLTHTFGGDEELIKPVIDSRMNAINSFLLSRDFSNIIESIVKIKKYRVSVLKHAESTNIDVDSERRLLNSLMRLDSYSYDVIDRTIRFFKEYSGVSDEELDRSANLISQKSREVQIIQSRLIDEMEEIDDAEEE